MGNDKRLPYLRQVSTKHFVSSRQLENQQRVVPPAVLQLIVITFQLVSLLQSRHGQLGIQRSTSVKLIVQARNAGFLVNMMRNLKSKLRSSQHSVLVLKAV